MVADMVPSVDVTAHGERVARALDIPYPWLDGVIKAESGWDPSIRNKLSGASGLIQWLGKRPAELGTSLAAIRQMDAHEQLDLVEADLGRWRGKFKRPVDVYLAVFAPKFVGASNSTALYAKPSQAYDDNQAVDMNRDGVIDVSDLAAWLARATSGKPVTPRAKTWEPVDGGDVAGLVLGALVLYAAWRLFNPEPRPARRRRRRALA